MPCGVSVDAVGHREVRRGAGRGRSRTSTTASASGSSSDAEQPASSQHGADGQRRHADAVVMRPFCTRGSLSSRRNARRSTPSPRRARSAPAPSCRARGPSPRGRRGCRSRRSRSTAYRSRPGGGSGGRSRRSRRSRRSSCVRSSAARSFAFGDRSALRDSGSTATLTGARRGSSRSTVRLSTPPLVLGASSSV